MKAARLPSGLCREATTRQRFGLYQPRSYPQTWLTALAAGCAMAAGVHARVAEADTVDLATHQPPREIEHGRSGALSSRHLGGVGLDLVVAGFAGDDEAARLPRQCCRASREGRDRISPVPSQKSFRHWLPNRQHD